MHAIADRTTTISIHALQPGAGLAAATPQQSPCASGHQCELCLAGALAEGGQLRLDVPHFARRRLKEGRSLYHAGERLQFLYAVRSGTFKSTILARDGREQVTGFHLAGDVLGLDGMAGDAHASSALALEDAEVCSIPYADLRALCTGNPRAQRALSRLLAQEIVREHTQVMMLGTMSAEERVAFFLLNVSARMQARGWSASDFHLRMSRAEIGSYLGLTLETVSRTFSAFQQRGLLEVQKKHLRIVDLPALAQAYDSAVQ